MDLRRAYKLLGLCFGADLDTVKSAFRRQAFDSHPDLHPEDPRAAQKFEDLNAAYLYLKKYLIDRETQKTPGKWIWSRSKNHNPAPGSGASETTHPKEAKAGNKKKGFAARQEEKLRDILDDPFAHLIFQDIFQKIKPSKPSVSTRTQRDTGTRKKRLNLSRDKGNTDLNVSDTMLSGIKNWFRSKLNDHQVIRLPKQQLQPGNMVRVQARTRGKDTRVIHFRLPSNFVAEQPIRLKGQGRSLGPFRGDLFLRLLPKQPDTT